MKSDAIYVRPLLTVVVLADEDVVRTSTNGREYGVDWNSAWDGYIPTED